MDIYRHIGRDISLLYRYNSMYMEDNFKDLGLHHGQIIFLAQLFTQDGITQEALTSELNFDKATTAKALKSLETIGYISRHSDAQDKRCKRIMLTHKANLIRARFFEVLDGFESKATKGFTKSEIEHFRGFLKRATETLIK